MHVLFHPISSNYNLFFFSYAASPLLLEAFAFASFHRHATGRETCLEVQVGAHHKALLLEIRSASPHNRLIGGVQVPVTTADQPGSSTK